MATGPRGTAESWRFGGYEIVVSRVRREPASQEATALGRCVAAADFLQPVRVTRNPH